MADKTKTTYPFYVRKFINREKFESGAYIIASIERETTRWKNSAGEDKVNNYLYPTLHIADCSRVVSLDVHADNAKTRANVLFKLNTLIDTLTKFRDALVAEWEKDKEKK